MIDLSKAKPGDRFKCRSGRIVVFDGPSSVPMYPYQVDGFSYSQKGEFYSGYEHMKDIIEKLPKARRKRARKTMDTVKSYSKPLSTSDTPTEADSDALAAIIWFIKRARHANADFPLNNAHTEALRKFRVQFMSKNHDTPTNP